MKQKILLTGGSGFIGRNILESFLAEKYDIVAPGRHELDLMDTNSVDSFFKTRTFDVVVHSAVKPGHRNALDHDRLLYSNLKFFETLLRHRSRYEKFINLGSGAVYDTSCSISMVSESSLYNRIGASDHDFCKYVISRQIQDLDGFVDLNIFGIFGKYEDYAIRFISNAICKTLFDLPITLRQDRLFSYLYIDDLMPILAFFIDNKVAHRSYNIVPDYTTSLLGLATLIQEISGQNEPVSVLTPGFGLDYTGSNARLLGEFPTLSFTSLPLSVQLLYNWYSNRKDMLLKSDFLFDK